jgi:hypothetical protein
MPTVNTHCITATSPDAPAITSPTCPQMRKARIAAPYLKSASRRHAGRRRI